uniref:Uncharacterized protein n=1 Tax=Plectus sambesii TaxID=2011161 RepID=A0A914W476_9BILA
MHVACDQPIAGPNVFRRRSDRPMVEGGRVVHGNHYQIGQQAGDSGRYFQWIGRARRRRGGAVHPGTGAQRAAQPGPVAPKITHAGGPAPHNADKGRRAPRTAAARPSSPSVRPSPPACPSSTQSSVTHESVRVSPAPFSCSQPLNASS